MANLICCLIFESPPSSASPGNTNKSCFFRSEQVTVLHRAFDCYLTDSPDEPDWKAIAAAQKLADQLQLLQNENLTKSHVLFIPKSLPQMSHLNVTLHSFTLFRFAFRSSGFHSASQFSERISSRRTSALQLFFDLCI